MTNIDDDQLLTMQLIKTEKQIARVFKGCGLSVTMKCNPKLVDFLDVTFDPVDEICKSYRKPNYKPLYIKKNIVTTHQIYQSNSPNPLKNVYVKLHQTLMY